MSNNTSSHMSYNMSNNIANSSNYRNHRNDFLHLVCLNFRHVHSRGFCFVLSNGTENDAVNFIFDDMKNEHIL